MPARPPRLTAASVALLGSIGCGGDDGAPAARDQPPAETVAVARLAYDPVELAVPAGTTVTWRNDEPITHTVTSGAVTGVDAASGLRSAEMPDGTFDGPLDAKGATFSFRFAEAGTYSYFCSIHKGMNARVVVT